MRVSENKKVNVAVNFLFYAGLAIGLLGFVAANWFETLFTQTAGYVLAWISSAAFAFSVMFIAIAGGVCSKVWYWGLISSLIWAIGGFVLVMSYLSVSAFGYTGAIELSDAVVHSGAYGILAKVVIFAGLTFFGTSFCYMGLSLWHRNKSLPGSIILFAGTNVCLWSGYVLFRLMHWSTEIMIIFKVLGICTAAIFVLLIFIAVWIEKYRQKSDEGGA